MTAPGMPERPRPLHLPFAARRGTPPMPVGIQTRRRRRRSARWRQGGAGLLLGCSGAGILLLLLQLPERLDTVLLVSHAVDNLIRGLGLMAMGLLQLAAVLGLAVLALFALLLLVAGGMRLIRALGPRSGKPS